jgi:hypothetical protein
LSLPNHPCWYTKSAAALLTLEGHLLNIIEYQDLQEQRESAALWKAAGAPDALIPKEEAASAAALILTEKQREQ